ncbi:MAG TPA: universal stress protein [Actinomycetota bacterium]|nr:universal stress protein [Actinomycetota bacterium]
MAYKRIVLATDGSPFAQSAEHVAATLARATKARELLIVHTYARPDRAQAAVERAEAAVRAEGLEPQVVLRDGAPAEDIVEVADVREADLIVLGSRGLSLGAQIIGSVAAKVARHAPCDVLLVRERPVGQREEGAMPYARMLVATDGSSTADRAARKGYALATRLGASVTLAFVGHPKTGELILKDTAATIGEGVAPATMLILQGDPAEAIMEAAAREGLDLIVVGNRGLAGAKGLFLASVPKKVSEYAPCDVLIARTVAQSLSEIGKGEGGIVATGDHKVAVYRDEKGVVHALSAKCTHMGCTVKWNPTQKTWDCPCHGSRYSPTGQVVNGPAAKPLEPTDL